MSTQMDCYETVYLMKEHLNFYEENIEQKLLDAGLAKRVVVMTIEEWMQMRGLKPDRYQNESGEETTKFEAGDCFSNSPADFELFGKLSTNSKEQNQNLFDANKTEHEERACTDVNRITENSEQASESVQRSIGSHITSLTRHLITIFAHLFDTVVNFLGFLGKKSD